MCTRSFCQSRMPARWTYSRLLYEARSSESSRRTQGRLCPYQCTRPCSLVNRILRLLFRQHLGRKLCQRDTRLCYTHYEPRQVTYYPRVTLYHREIIQLKYNMHIYLLANAGKVVHWRTHPGALWQDTITGKMLRN
jgi:hypothetical protein